MAARRPAPMPRPTRPVTIEHTAHGFGVRHTTPDTHLHTYTHTDTHEDTDTDTDTPPHPHRRRHTPKPHHDINAHLSSLERCDKVLWLLPPILAHVHGPKRQRLGRQILDRHLDQLPWGDCVEAAVGATIV